MKEEVNGKRRLSTWGIVASFLFVVGFGPLAFNTVFEPKVEDSAKAPTKPNTTSPTSTPQNTQSNPASRNTSPAQLQNRAISRLGDEVFEVAQDERSEPVQRSNKIGITVSSFKPTKINIPAGKVMVLSGFQCQVQIIKNGERSVLVKGDELQLDNYQTNSATVYLTARTNGQPTQDKKRRSVFSSKRNERVEDLGDMEREFLEEKSRCSGFYQIL